MRIKALFILCSFLTAISVEGREPEKKIKVQQPTALQTQLLDQRVSELMADHVGIKKGIVPEGLASIEWYIQEELEDLEDLEALNYPADEL
ncbi:MAG: peptidoglycan-binding protein, partial [Tannerella sp.]|nr:peptidoglycan-binding protein [Tannerella sp.]